tara:strand:- start:643 stop:1080 length:438 start_codon:yes stop_codon:yes gene_type:complete
MNKKEQKIFRAWIALIRTNQAALDNVEDCLKKEGLPPLGWYDVLLEINRETDKCLRLQDIGQRVLLSKNNVTRLIDRLEKAKLVVRKKCPEDGRGVFAYITHKGQNMLKRMWPIYREAVKTHFAQNLEEHEINALITIYEKIKIK